MEEVEGVLFLKRHLDDVEKAMQGYPRRYKVVPLNDKWGVLFIDAPSFFGFSEAPKLIEISRQIPLLHYFDADEGGWGYKIYYAGSEIADAFVVWDECDKSDYPPQNHNTDAFKYFDVSDETAHQVGQLIASGIDIPHPPYFSDFLNLRELDEYMNFSDYD